MKSAAILAPGSPVPRPASSGEARWRTSAAIRAAPSGSGASGSLASGGSKIGGSGASGGGGESGSAGGAQRASARTSARRRRGERRTAGWVYYETGGDAQRGALAPARRSATRQRAGAEVSKVDRRT